jgi:RNA polymerase sigma-70 factor (ECF subfamily)
METSPRLSAAQAGDESAFAELTLPFQRELHIHCYRMLGSLDDADDALQETLLRAWRSLDRFEPLAPFRAWLYRIATNVCLTMLERRVRRGEVPLTAEKEGEPMHLDPYPDRLLDELTSPAEDPQNVAVQQEGVELAFVAAAQVLPPRQRATLLLREVIGYSAAEVAPMLETSVAGVNSALQRARATLEQERAAGRVTRTHAGAEAETEQLLISRLVDAWQAADVPSIVALLTKDALLTMPPQPYRYAGATAIGEFFADLPRGGQLDRFRLVPVRANRQPALAAYYRQDDGRYQAHSLFVLAIEGEAIASIVRFGGPPLFPRFGLPMVLDTYELQ